MQINSVSFGAHRVFKCVEPKISEQDLDDGIIMPYANKAEKAQQVIHQRMKGLGYERADFDTVLNGDTVTLLTANDLLIHESYKKQAEKASPAEFEKIEKSLGKDFKDQMLDKLALLLNPNKPEAEEITSSKDIRHWSGFNKHLI